MADFASVAAEREVQDLTTSLNDAVKSYDPSATPNGKASRFEIITKARELIMAMTDPMDMAAMHVAMGNEVSILRTLLDLKVFNHIPQSGSISIEALAKATNVEVALLARLMRLTVCTGLVHQLDNLEYAHTKFSFAYAQTAGPGQVFKLVYDESILHISRLHLYLKEKGLSEPTDELTSPYTWTEGQEGISVWKIMSQYPERFETFHKGLASLEGSISTTGFYDFSKLNGLDDRPILVDIGGGKGQVIQRILQAHPELPPEKFVLQDLPEVIAMANNPDSLLPKQVQRSEHNFTAAQPVKGAKAYFLRHIFHDYASDSYCTNILKQIIPAMDPDSVILIADYIMPLKPTPADLPVVTFDITLMNMAGKERTMEEWSRLLNNVGLEIGNVHRSKRDHASIIEAKLAATNGTSTVASNVA